MKQTPQKQSLSKESISLLNAVAKSCRSTIISMLKQSQSGHTGGSLGCIDYLTFLYTQKICKTGEKIIISNGHISPAVYAILAELTYINKQEVIKGFRKIGYPYEGHVTRHVRGVWYGTGPLGAGISAASGFALAEKLKKTDKKVYALIGDGECQEGQVYEMMNFAKKYELDNFVVFVDYNKVQLSDSIEKIMPIDIAFLFKAAGWHVIEIDGHDFEEINKGILEAESITGKPVVLLGHTTMGKGIDFIEKAGKENKADWHGKAPKPEEADNALEQLTLTSEEQHIIDSFVKKEITWKPPKPSNEQTQLTHEVHTGTPMLYTPDTLTDCRSAYGNALLDIAQKNKHIIALTADLAESVKTNGVKEHLPERHIECGIAEQHMVSCSGGLSLSGFIPFCSTFGAFMTSRAKDQARVNDINNTNVKMVATHCGLSVGEDGPTHQAIDDAGSTLGFFNTMQMEPADPNHCDRIIRFAASNYGNMYIRMGRHKIPVLTTKEGKPFFGKTYKYKYGKCEVLREGKHLTIVAIGSTVIEALRAHEALLKKNIKVEIIIASSIKKFDNALFTSIQKTKRVLTVEDHNTYSGLGGQVARALEEKQIHVKSFNMIGVQEYQLSGTAEALYKAAGLDSSSIIKKIQSILKK